MNALVAPPSVTPKKIDPKSGFALLEQPVDVVVSTPVLDSGNPLTAKDPKSGTYLLDPAAAQTTFSLGVLLYRIKTDGSIEVYNGAAWTPEAGLDLLFAGLKPTELAFDAPSNTWKGTFVLSTVADATDPAFETSAASHRPMYGFLTVFRSPKSGPVDAARSSLSAPFGAIATADTANVKPGLVKHLASTSDPQSADGFAIFVKDNAGLPAADMLVSSDGTLPARVMLQLYSGGVVRASVSLDSSGAVHLMSATQAVVDAPIVQLNGELRAQNIRYKPFDGSPERYL